LPVLGDYELSAVQELGAIQKSPGKIGAIEYRFEDVGAVQMRSRQIRPAQIRASEVGTPKIGSGKVESTQVEASQTSPRQEFERFIYLYGALDTCFALATELTPPARWLSHAERIGWMCDLLGMPVSVWAKTTPGIPPKWPLYATRRCTRPCL
jgi:hypothetical protein